MDGCYSCVSSQCHYCWIPYPHPSATFPCRGNATSPGANQSAVGMPQTMGTPISVQQHMKRLPSLLNLRPPTTHILIATMPPLAQTSPQSSPTSTVAISQTSPTPAPLSVNKSEESLSYSTPIQFPVSMIRSFNSFTIRSFFLSHPAHTVPPQYPVSPQYPCFLFNSRYHEEDSTW